ncbi:MAG: hypothetical protein LBP92_13240 [Deltaproteobacteria bacterium]|nr:hypothetical protein [Deltaproteobacteria bacterium]
MLALLDSGLGKTGPKPVLEYGNPLYPELFSRLQFFFPKFDLELGENTNILKTRGFYLPVIGGLSLLPGPHFGFKKSTLGKGHLRKKSPCLAGRRK